MWLQCSSACLLCVLAVAQLFETLQSKWGTSYYRAGFLPSDTHTFRVGTVCLNSSSVWVRCVRVSARMLPCCALVCLGEVSWRPAEWSSQVWQKDKRLTGGRPCWSAKLKDKDKRIENGKVEGKGNGLLTAGQTYDFAFEGCQLLNGRETNCGNSLQSSEQVFTLWSRVHKLLSLSCALLDLEEACYAVPSGVPWMWGAAEVDNVGVAFGLIQWCLLSPLWYLYTVACRVSKSEVIPFCWQ